MTEAPTENAEAGGRGRPRPQDTVERDEKIYKQLLDGGAATREELAEKTGVSSSLVYMSLFRLRRDGQVQRASKPDGGKSTHAWEAVAR